MKFLKAMDSEPPLYKDYLLLKPKEASVLELGCLLCSSNITNRRFIDCSEGVEIREFGQRWYLLISVVAQKVLVALEPFLKIVGDMLELWLNRIASNGGIIRLFFNILRG